MPANQRHCHGGGAASTPSITPTRQPAVQCPAATGTWRGLKVAPECRCSEYDRDDYSYSQNVEPMIARMLGGMWSPYDGTEFDSLRESDIEHIVAVSEAHDSGLCAASRNLRRMFASDLGQLDASSTGSQSQSEGSEGCGRMVAVLVCRAHRSGAAQIQPDD